MNSNIWSANLPNSKITELYRSENEEFSNEEVDSCNSFRIDHKTPLVKDKIAECYIREMKKIEVWTYLFRQLTNSTDLLFGLCELEGKVEFCRGVIESLISIQEEFSKLENRLQIEQIGPQNAESKAWDFKTSDKASMLEEVLKEKEVHIDDVSRENHVKNKFRPPLSPNVFSEKQIDVFSDKKDDLNLEKYADIFDEEGMIEFQLLTELMNEGKYSFYEAVVLLIRERASLMANTSSSKQEKSSFRKNSDEPFVEDRPISTPLNVKRLFNRIHRKLLFEKSEASKEETPNHEQMVQKYNEKLQKAEDRRMKLNEMRSEAITKTIHRVEEVKLKQSEQINKKQETIDKKEHDYYQRKLVKLAVLKKKAKDNKMKASEIAFLQLLEKNAKKRNLDTKLDETRKRRLNIINKITEKNKKVEDLLTSVKSRKEKIDNEKKNLALKKLNKVDEAQKRRQQILEEKVKKQFKTTDETSPVKHDSKNLEEDNTKIKILYLIEEKEKLDKIFKEIKIPDQISIVRSFDDKLSCFSDETVPNFSKIDRSPNNSVDKEFKQSQKRKKKKNAKNQTQKNNTEKSQNDETKDEECEKRRNVRTRKAYYRFLTKDTESLHKIRQLKIKNMSMIQKKNAMSSDALDFNEDISELPELLCRDEKNFKDERVIQNDKCYCTLCDLILKEFENVENHMNSKLHRKNKSHYCLTFSEDTNSIVFVSEGNLSVERLSAMKNKCKKIKQQLSTKSLSSEAVCLGRENFPSANKPRLQKLTIEFEKILQSPVKDYDALKFILSDFSKILEKNVENDLHILRQIRFINVFVDLFRTITTTPKINNLNLIELFNEHFKIFSKIMLIKENRVFLLLTNRAIPILDLLIWSWNLSTKFLQCLQYIPMLLQTLSLLLKSKVPKDKAYFKSFFVEYLIFSGFILKIKAKIVGTDFNANLDDSKSKIQNVLQKVLQFLETLTSLLEAKNVRQLGEGMTINSSVYFVLTESDMAGCIQLLASLLLSKGQYSKGIKVVPKNLLNQSILVIRILNNFARGDLRALQSTLGGNSFNSDQFYHIQAFLYDYCTANFSNNSEVYDVLQELIILTGYFCLQNPQNQSILSRGTENHTIVYKLANLPYQFYFGDAIYKDLLFPTLLSIVYKSERNLTILLSEVNRNIILDFVKTKIETYKTAIFEKNSESWSDLHHLTLPFEKCSHSSISNNNVSNPVFNSHSLHMRFPVEMLSDLEKFIVDFEN